MDTNVLWEFVSYMFPGEVAGKDKGSWTLRNAIFNNAIWHIDEED